MTPRDAFTEAVYQARRFRYIPDATRAEPWLDTWDTVAEFERRGGGDCDGFAIWTVEQGYHAALLGAAPGAPLGTWSVILGTVLVHGTWTGHMWSALVDGRGLWWADSTWGLLPDEPAALGWPDRRRPASRWTFNGIVFGSQEDYPVENLA